MKLKKIVLATAIAMAAASANAAVTCDASGVCTSDATSASGFTWDYQVSGVKYEGVAYIGAANQTTINNAKASTDSGLNAAYKLMELVNHYSRLSYPTGTNSTFGGISTEYAEQYAKSANAIMQSLNAAERTTVSNLLVNGSSVSNRFTSTPLVALKTKHDSSMVSTRAQDALPLSGLLRTEGSTSAAPYGYTLSSTSKAFVETVFNSATAPTVSYDYWSSGVGPKYGAILNMVNSGAITTSNTTLVNNVKAALDNYINNTMTPTGQYSIAGLGSALSYVGNGYTLTGAQVDKILATAKDATVADNVQTSAAGALLNTLGATNTTLTAAQASSVVDVLTNSGAKIGATMVINQAGLSALMGVVAQTGNNVIAATVNYQPAVGLTVDPLTASAYIGVVSANLASGQYGAATLTASQANNFMQVIDAAPGITLDASKASFVLSAASTSGLAIDAARANTVLTAATTAGVTVTDAAQASTVLKAATVATAPVCN